MTNSETTEPRPNFVRSLQRGLLVIRVFDSDEPELSLSEVARKTGLSRATARRSLLTLEALGYLGSNGRRFALRPRVLELGYAYLSSIRLPALALPYLESMVSDVKESSSISVLDDDDIVYIARVPTSRIMSVNINVGTRFPAMATSMGRVLIANLPLEERSQKVSKGLVKYTARTITNRATLESILEKVHTEGWAEVDEELEEGLRAVAMPIHDASLRVVAAVNISAHASRVRMDELRNRFLPRLRETVELIESDLKSMPPLPSRH